MLDASSSRVFSALVLWCCCAAAVVPAEAVAQPAPSPTPTAATPNETAQSGPSSSSSWWGTEDQIALDVLKEDVGFLDAENRTSARHFEFISEAGHHTTFQYKSRLADNTVDLLHGFSSLHVACTGENASSVLLTGTDVELKRLQHQLERVAAAQKGVKVFGDCHTSPHVHSADDRDQMAGVVIRVELLPCTRTQRRQHQKHQAEAGHDHGIASVDGAAIGAMHGGNAGAGAGGGASALAPGAACVVGAIHLELQPISFTQLFDTLHLQMFSANDTFQAHRPMLEAHLNPNGTGKPVQESIFSDEEIEVLRNHTNPNAHVVIDRRPPKRRKLLLFLLGSMFVSYLVGQVIDGTEYTLWSKELGSFNIWNYNTWTQAAYQTEYGISFPGLPDWLTLTCVDCYMGCTASSVMIILEINWAGIINPAGAVDLRAALALNIRTQLNLNAKASLEHKETIDWTVPMDKVPNPLKYQASVIGIGIKLGLEPGLTLRTVVDFTGTIEAQAGFQIDTFFVTSVGVMDFKPSAALARLPEFTPLPAFVKVNAKGSVKPMFIPKLSIVGEAEAGSLIGLGLTLYIEVEAYAEVHFEYATGQLGQPTALVDTFCYASDLDDRCHSAEAKYDTRLSTSAGLDTNVGIIFDITLFRYGPYDVSGKWRLDDLSLDRYTFKSECFCITLGNCEVQANRCAFGAADDFQANLDAGMSNGFGTITGFACTSDDVCLGGYYCHSNGVCHVFDATYCSSHACGRGDIGCSSPSQCGDKECSHDVCEQYHTRHSALPWWAKCCTSNCVTHADCRDDEMCVPYTGACMPGATAAQTLWVGQWGKGEYGTPCTVVSGFHNCLPGFACNKYCNTVNHFGYNDAQSRMMAGLACCGIDSSSPYMTDCDGKSTTLAPTWVHDGVCDDRTPNNFNCRKYQFDGGDCYRSVRSSSSSSSVSVSMDDDQPGKVARTGAGAGTSATASSTRTSDANTTTDTDKPTLLHASNITADCDGTNVTVSELETWLANGVCDDGSESGWNLNCATFEFDLGDCKKQPCSAKCGPSSTCDEVLELTGGNETCADLEDRGCDCSGCECLWAKVKFGDLSDCNGRTFNTEEQFRIGDGLCDDGLRNVDGSAPDFACAKFDCDAGDCHACVLDSAQQCASDADCANEAHVCMRGHCVAVDLEWVCPDGACDEGDGLCYDSSQCAPGLQCGLNNCGDYHPRLLRDPVFAFLNDTAQNQSLGAYTANCCEPPPTPKGTCDPAGCLGSTSCDFFSNVTTCATLEHSFECDCSGCSCPLDVPDNCTDCLGNNCSDSVLRLGDGVCDAMFNCLAHACDAGDCGGNATHCPTSGDDNNETCLDCDSNDCTGREWWVGDGFCDFEGLFDIHFDCATWSYDGGDCGCVDCGGGQCSGFESWVGDNICDAYGVAAAFGVPDFNCSAWEYDGGDCDVIDTGSGVAACTDCQGWNCTGLEHWVGDGSCDDGTFGLFFNCEEYSCDGGDCACATTSTDCQGQDSSVTEYWVGDGLCDDGTFGYYFNCDKWNCDGGDCDCDGSSVGANCTDCYGVACPDGLDALWVGDGICDAMFNCPLFSDDGGDCTQVECTDCNGEDCSAETHWIGDGVCDTGGHVDFNCSKFSCDGGDCGCGLAGGVAASVGVIFVVTAAVALVAA